VEERASYLPPRLSVFRDCVCNHLTPPTLTAGGERGGKKKREKKGRREKGLRKQEKEKPSEERK